MTKPIAVPELDEEALRCEIRREYAEVATHPSRGFHFHTGRPLARLLGYSSEWLDHVPEPSIESFAGTGNPFSMGAIMAGERVVDVGSGGGIDSLIAAWMTGDTGRVIGVDMTPEMLDKARVSATTIGARNVEFHSGHAEALPVEDAWADVVISNGVVNLCPDKLQVFREIYRVLRPGGRIQLGDILVQKAVPDSAKRDIGLWKG
ncbi:MAG TPA: methyltransferase domain-containing protein [Candidatus Eisenbacteria bacterium]|nr:methyltransferase domain-containing protein [Candidatus Eisenbacteria bacterium]